MAGADHTAVGENAELLVEAVAGVEAPAGFEAHVAGPATLENDFIRLAEEGLQRGESIGLAVALVVLVFVFGAVVAGLIPIILAVMAIAIALGAAALFGLAFDLPFFIANIITMLGLAVGIDYSLFIVSRYREERAGGRSTCSTPSPGPGPRRAGRCCSPGSPWWSPWPACCCCPTPSTAASGWGPSSWWWWRWSPR